MICRLVVLLNSKMLILMFLMSVLFAQEPDGEIIIEEAELEDAKWFKVDDLPNIPPKLSISGQLISSYLEDRSKL